MAQGGASRPGWLRVVGRGGLIGVLREASHGEHGWEIAGKGAASFVGGSLLGQLVTGGGDLNAANPVHLVLAVAIIGGFVAFWIGLAREWNRWRVQLSQNGGPGRGAAPAVGYLDGVRAPVAESSSLAPVVADVADVPEPAILPAAPVQAVVAESAAVPATPEPPASTAPVPARPAKDDVLTDAIRRSRQGVAGERYVAKVLSDLPRSRYEVNDGFILGKADVGEHIGDIDYLVSKLGTNRAVVVEVKTTSPLQPGGNGSTYGERHRRQVARQARAVERASDEPIEVVAVVVYVPRPGATGRERTLRSLKHDEHTVDGRAVHSVGVAGLKQLVREVLEDA